MKKVFLLVVSALILFSCHSQGEPTIKYTVKKVFENERHQLKILAEFPADITGITKLMFLDKAWGEENLHQCIGDMKLLNAEASIHKNKDEGFIEIHHDPGLGNLRFEYHILQDSPGVLTDQKSYRPVVQPKYFSAFSHSLFMVPQTGMHPETGLMDIEISWKGFSEENIVHNSFGSKESVQFLEATSLNEFHTAVFVGGDFRVYPFKIEGNDVSLAIRGEWETFSDDEIVNMLQKTITAQRSFWRDHSQPYFTVTLVPTHRENGSSYGGTGLTNSFATRATNNKNLLLKDLTYLFNHELTHNWIGHSIKNANEEGQYWFSEGFTEYYTIKNIASNQIIGLDHAYFIDEINSFVSNLERSPVKDKPNSSINYDNFWSSRDYEKLPYYRGALFAFYLDQKIQMDSKGKHSLDDLMLDFYRDALASGQRMHKEYFIEKANQYLNEDLQPFFNTHIYSGKPMPIGDIFKDLGLDHAPFSNAYHLGFEFTEDKKHVAEIDIDSKAYEAGLRKGDRVSFRSYMHRPDREAKLTVIREGKEDTIRFFPAKVLPIPKLKHNDKNTAALAFKGS